MKPAATFTATGSAEYLDDSREGFKLSLHLDDQGDVYVSVIPEGDRVGRACVRLCASGGAGNVAPGLLKAMRQAHDAIKAAAEGRALASELEPEPAAVDALRACVEAFKFLRAVYRWGSDPAALTDEDRAIVESRRWLHGKELLSQVIEPAISRAQAALDGTAPGAWVGREVIEALATCPSPLVYVRKGFGDAWQWWTSAVRPAQKGEAESQTAAEEAGALAVARALGLTPEPTP